MNLSESSVPPGETKTNTRLDLLRRPHRGNTSVPVRGPNRRSLRGGDSELFLFRPRFDPGRISGFGGFWRQEEEGSYLLGVVQDPCLVADCPLGTQLPKLPPCCFWLDETVHNSCPFLAGSRGGLMPVIVFISLG